MKSKPISGHSFRSLKKRNSSTYRNWLKRLPQVPLGINYLGKDGKTHLHACRQFHLKMPDYYDFSVKKNTWIYLPQNKPVSEAIITHCPVCNLRLERMLRYNENTVYLVLTKERSDVDLFLNSKQYKFSTLNNESFSDFIITLFKRFRNNDGGFCPQCNHKLAELKQPPGIFCCINSKCIAKKQNMMYNLEDISDSGIVVALSDDLYQFDETDANLNVIWKSHEIKRIFAYALVGRIRVVNYAKYLEGELCDL